jgi:L-threonylcarbamoyladenylate synthase
VFDALRAFDASDVSHIYAQCPDDAGLGLAVGNRLKKAAGFHVVNVDRPIVIGLTGPTGAGKTSALLALERLGGLILDCDAIYHQMLQTDEGLRRTITDAFGDVFDENGLNRQKLGAVVFADPSAMDRLNAIIYEYIPREVESRIAATDAPVVGIDAINLFESGLARLCHRTVGLLAPPEVRLRRIMARDGIGEEYARLRIAAQKGDEFYRTRCTDILMNDAASAAEFENKAYAFFCHMIQKINNNKEESNHE